MPISAIGVESREYTSIGHLGYDVFNSSCWVMRALYSFVELGWVDAHPDLAVGLPDDCDAAYLWSWVILTNNHAFFYHPVQLSFDQVAGGVRYASGWVYNGYDIWVRVEVISFVYAS